MKLLNDQWTCMVHELGYESFAATLRDLILETDTPVAITLGGRWGAGKTSMLRAVMASLGGHFDLIEVSEEGNNPQLHETLNPETCERKDRLKNVWPVWFNPWQYQYEEQPIIPLLHEIREQIRWRAKSKKAAAEMTIDAFDTVTRSLGTLVDTFPNLVFRRKVVDLGEKTIQNLENVRSERTKREFRNPTDGQCFYRAFEDAIEMVVGKDGRLVVFIDDLDRCGDEQVFKLLEQIKLYLNGKRCVFVFGLDRTHVENAVARAAKYNIDEARQYVQKLFQARFHLPSPDPDKLKTFIEKQLQVLGVNGELSEDFAQYIPCNPRMIKNILNGLPLYLKSVHALGAAPEEDYEKKCMLVYLLRAFYPDAYELLQLNPDGTFDALKKCLQATEVDLNNELQNYLHFITENPIQKSPQNLQNEAVLMSEQRFHKVRSRAWQAQPIDKFHTAFYDTFGKVEEIKPFLL